MKKKSSEKNQNFPEFLQPLKQQGKLRTFTGKAPGLAKEGDKAAVNNPFNLNDDAGKLFREDLNRGYAALPDSQKDLTNFVLTQLAGNPAFKSVDLYSTPLTSAEAIPGSYNFVNKSFYLNRLGKAFTGTNPVTTLMHEGTHGLDDLHMKTYQKGALNFLAKHKKDTPISQDTGDWYTGAQNILGGGDRNHPFISSYPFTAVQKEIPAHFAYFTREHGKSGKDNNQLTYTDIQRELNDSELKKIGPQEDYYGDNYQLSALSEFPTFAMENINNPWITGTQRGRTDMGRKFLKKITKDVYGNFKELDPEFSTKYPNANQAFQNRISDLRNINKHPNAAAYVNRLQQKIAERYPISTSTNPGTISTTSTTSSRQVPQTQTGNVSNYSTPRNQSSSTSSRTGEQSSKMQSQSGKEQNLIRIPRLAYEDFLSKEEPGAYEDYLRERRLLEAESQRSITPTSFQHSGSVFRPAQTEVQSQVPSGQLGQMMTPNTRTPLTSQMMPNTGTQNPQQTYTPSTSTNPGTSHITTTSTAPSNLDTRNPGLKRTRSSPENSDEEYLGPEDYAYYPKNSPQDSAVESVNSDDDKNYKRGGRVRNPNFFSRFKMANYKLR